MRAARTALRLPALPQLRTKEPKRKTVSGRQPDCVVWLGAAFLAGYLPGIWLGRDGATALGQQLAVWYTESPESTAFTAAFGTRFAVGALQLCAVLLCGFCIWGIGLLVLFLRCAGDFSASVRPPWQRLTVRQDCCATAAIRLYRMLPRCCCVCGWPGGRRSWRHNCSVQRRGVPQGKRRGPCGGF